MLIKLSEKLKQRLLDLPESDMANVRFTDDTELLFVTVLDDGEQIDIPAPFAEKEIKDIFLPNHKSLRIHDLRLLDSPQLID